MTAPEPSSLSAEDTARLHVIERACLDAGLSPRWTETLTPLLTRALADERRRAGERVVEQIVAGIESQAPEMSAADARLYSRIADWLRRRYLRAALAADEPTPPSHEKEGQGHSSGCTGHDHMTNAEIQARYAKRDTPPTVPAAPSPHADQRDEEAGQ